MWVESETAPTSGVSAGDTRYLAACESTSRQILPRGQAEGADFQWDARRLFVLISINYRDREI